MRAGRHRSTPWIRDVGRMRTHRRPKAPPLFRTRTVQQQASAEARIHQFRSGCVSGRLALVVQPSAAGYTALAGHLIAQRAQGSRVCLFYLLSLILVWPP